MFTCVCSVSVGDRLQTQLGDCILLPPLVSSWWDLEARSHRGKQTAWTNLMREQPVRDRESAWETKSYRGELRGYSVTQCIMKQ